ncbi:MAG: amidase [Bryobacterales bacterium]|nr:amidase [Bryobacterales bacterium]
MPTPFDPDFDSALAAAAAIRSREISSLELTNHVLKRMDAFEPKLNAYVYQMRGEALAAAKAADEALAKGAPTGVFHGVPVNVKESFGVQGRPCTWGIPALRHSKAPANSTPVRRLLDTGSVLLGATNVPFLLMDGQAFNEIYGTSNNPWDLGRTPGGCSGGSAASLAAGMAFLSVGSDIGGSIRSPASFCGVYGHKPTLDIVDFKGHLPGGLQGTPGFSTLLAAAGPMARTAGDLDAALRMLAGPEPPDNKAFRWELPDPRHRSLREFRVGYLLEDATVPVSDETKAVLETAVRACEKAGASVKQGWPEGFHFSELLETYRFLLGAFDFSVTPPDRRQEAREALQSRPEIFVKGALSSFVEWQARNFQRLGYRAQWENYFQSFDVFLLPTTFTTAFPHDHTHPDARVLHTPEGAGYSFWNLVTYICPATLTGCPATTAPAGLSRSGLPVGLQIMGPYLEDATTMEFARLLALEIGRFQPPPGYGAA